MKHKNIKRKFAVFPGRPARQYTLVLRLQQSRDRYTKDRS